MDKIIDRNGYLARMGKPLQEKLKVLKYFYNEGSVVDVGCANGVVTMALAEMLPGCNFLGIDLDEGFVEEAKKNNTKAEQVKFECVYLRELLEREKKYEMVSFMSVLHEFYSYGEGVSSVVKAVADAHELLKPGGRIVIRDMVLEGFNRRNSYKVAEMKKKIRERGEYVKELDDFEKYWGEIKSVAELNHWLLKYMYADNWEREMRENYVGVSFEDYERIFSVLGLRILAKESYLLPYLENKWRDDFGFDETEMGLLKSTGILVVEK